MHTTCSVSQTMWLHRQNITGKPCKECHNKLDSVLVHESSEMKRERDLYRSFKGVVTLAGTSWHVM